MFVFVSLPNFYLNGITTTTKAAVTRDRLILEASPEACRLGVKAGISATLARRRCAGLDLREFRAKDYAERFEQVWSIFACYTPMLETTDFHTAYLEIGKDAHRYGGVEALMHDLRRSLKRATQVKLDWGGGADKWMAWLARGYNQFIPPQIESLVLSKLPIEAMGLPDHVAERMHHFDLHSLADVMNLPSGFLESHLGFDRDFVLRRLSRHKDPLRPNFPPNEYEVFSAITDQDEYAVQRAVAEVARTLAQRLANDSMSAARLRVRCTSKHGAVEQLIDLSRTTLSAARLERLIFSSLPSNCDLRGIEVSAAGLVPAFAPQESLWRAYANANREDSLERLQTRLQRRFGVQSLVSGTAALDSAAPRFAQLIYQTRGLTLP